VGLAEDQGRIQATTHLGAPVTVAFGSRDLVLLPHHARHIDQLPPDTSVQKPPGCDHVPISDNPGAVIALITQSADRAVAAAAKRPAGHPDGIAGSG
jgi:pimeloyl-ACP methyl ester carboxylesterase